LLQGGGQARHSIDEFSISAPALRVNRGHTIRILPPGAVQGLR
jgi:hypothetical protein